MKPPELLYMTDSSCRVRRRSTLR